MSLSGGGGAAARRRYCRRTHSFRFSRLACVGDRGVVGRGREMRTGIGLPAGLGGMKEIALPDGDPDPRQMRPK